MADEQASSNTQEGGLLFSGLKLWFSRQVPQRGYLIEQAKSNGATVVLQEKDADVLLVDHVRKSHAPGSHSYQFIERSIREGRVLDLDTFLVGAKEPTERPIGSTRIPASSTRRPFTEEDDQLLYNFIQPFREKGGSWKGNEIYKQFARIRPTHTFQSWRDRFIKKVCNEKRQVTETVVTPEDEAVEAEDVVERPTKRRRVQFEPNASEDAQTITVQVNTSPKRTPIPKPARTSAGTSAEQNKPVTPRRQPLEELPSSARRQVVSTPSRQSGTSSKSSSTADNNPGDTQSVSQILRSGGQKHGFLKDDIQMLFRALPHIKHYRHDQVTDAWEDFAAEYNHHTVEQWRMFFDCVIVPEYMRRHNLADENELLEHARKMVTETKGSESQGQDVSPAAGAPLRHRSKGSSPLLDEQRRQELERAQREEEIDYSTDSADSDIEVSSQQMRCGECRCRLHIKHSPKLIRRKSKVFCPDCAWAGGITETRNDHEEDEPDQEPDTTATNRPIAEIDLKSTILVDETERQLSTDFEPNSPHSQRASEPRPNEGRKRASQSTTTNSTSQTSQSQLTQIKIGSQSQQDHTLQEYSSLRIESIIEMTTQEPPESGQRPARSTVVSQNEPSAPSQYETAHAQNHPTSENLMFFPAENEDDAVSDRERRSSRSSSIIGLIGAGQEAQRPPSSHGVLSDTGSEYYPFEEMPERSTLWQTSPDRVRVANNDLEDGYELVSAASDYSSPSQQLITSSQAIILENDESEISDTESTAQQFETVKEHLRSDTQAVLQQSVDDIEDLLAFAVPSPEGGWEELDADEVSAETEEHQAKPHERPDTADSLDSQAALMSGALHSLDIPAESDKMSDALQSSTPTSPGGPSTPKRRLLRQDNLSTPQSQRRITAAHRQQNNDSEPDSDSSSDSEPETQGTQQAEFDDLWFAEQANRFANRQHIDEDSAYNLIAAAFVATSMHHQLASVVLKRMFDNHENVARYYLRRGQKLADVTDNNAKSFLPENVPGCWTDEDDRKLMSRDRNEIAKMEAKHGEEETMGRVYFLEEMHGR